MKNNLIPEENEKDGKIGPHLKFGRVVQMN